jgi:hypothetical protein
MQHNYSEFIQRRWPNDKRLDFYVKPTLPATKLGKVLARYTKINSPSDVVAFYTFSGFMSGSDIVLTGQGCYYDKGFFWLEDVKGARSDGDKVVIDANQAGSLTQHRFAAENEEAAKLLASFFDALSYESKAEPITSAVNEYKDLNTSEIRWVQLRDEVMLTIDKLHERFQDGKIGLTEYENTKTDLLSRL